MEAYYILIVGFLFVLAISLLIVGVSNDAVNFLNSAIGSKAASFKVILAIAAVGVVVGAVFSNGMMEVARKGIFNPEHFVFGEIMVIFLAVMLTNLLLLDLFNTIGLPTSTTVSIVFGILGAAVAVALFKVLAADAGMDYIGKYINIESSVMIVIGIFLSVIIAFTMGMLIQWIVRLTFSFNTDKSYKYWAGIWGGFAITAILFFLLIKGAKGSTLVSAEMLSYIHSHTTQILLISFIGWTFVFQLLVLFTKINILKITVLVGTFALAMAFAGNDLVNFIGVPLAGLESFKAFMSSGSADPNGFLMQTLLEPVNTPLYFLVIAGLIMVLTLRFSKKAKSVIATTIDLSRQDEGAERFASSSLARIIVRRSIEISNSISKYTPSVVSKFIMNRFDTEIVQNKKEEKVAFDLVRASVNLVMASILIAIGTSYKLPLSTTYVTFMVAMGTSLSDGAWGRDSAVYRITGVLTVIGGWFFTAFMAFLASFIIAAIIFYGKLPAILILMVFSIYILLKTHAFHKNKSERSEKADNEAKTASFVILKSCDDEVISSITKVSKILNATFTSFFKEKRKEFKSLRKETKQLTKDIKKIQEDIPNTLKKFEDTDLASGHYYVEVVAYMKEMCNSLSHIVQPAFIHLENNHAIDKEQLDKLKDFNDQLNEFLKVAVKLLKNRSYGKLDELIKRRDDLINQANEILFGRIKILKKNQKGVKLSITYIEMLSESKNLVLNLVRLVKADIKLIDSILIVEVNVEEKV